MTYVVIQMHPVIHDWVSNVWGTFPDEDSAEQFKLTLDPKEGEAFLELVQTPPQEA